MGARALAGSAWTATRDVLVESRVISVDRGRIAKRDISLVHRCYSITAQPWRIWDMVFFFTVL